MAHKTGLPPGTPKFVEIFYPEHNTLVSRSGVRAVGESDNTLLSNFDSLVSLPKTRAQKVIPALSRLSESPHSILSSAKLTSNEKALFCRDYPNNALASFMLGYRTLQGEGLRKLIFSTDNNRAPFFQNFEFNSLSAALLFPTRAANDNHPDYPVVDDATEKIFKKNPFLRQTHRVIAAEAAHKFGFRILDKRVGVLNRIHQDKPDWLTEDGVLDRSLLLQMIESLHQLENSELALNLCNKIMQTLAHYQDQEFFVGANSRFSDLRDKVLKEWQPRKPEATKPTPAPSQPTSSFILPKIVISAPEEEASSSKPQKVKKTKKYQYQRIFSPLFGKSKSEQASAKQDSQIDHETITLMVPEGVGLGAGENQLHIQIQSALLKRADAELKSSTMLQEYLPAFEQLYDTVTQNRVESSKDHSAMLYQELEITRELLNMPNLTAWQLISLLTSAKHTSPLPAKSTFGVLNQQLYPLAKRMALVKEIEEKNCAKGVKGTKSIAKFASLQKGINVLSKYIGLLDCPSLLTESDYKCAFNFIRFEYDLLAQKQGLIKQNAQIMEAVMAIRKNLISLYLAYQEKLSPDAPIWLQSYAKQQAMLTNLLDLFEKPLQTDVSICSQIELAMMQMLKTYGLAAPKAVLQSGVSKDSREIITRF